MSSRPEGALSLSELLEHNQMNTKTSEPVRSIKDRVTTVIFLMAYLKGMVWLLE